MPAELTNAEWDRAGKLEVYYVWYEDRFHYGDDRTGFAVTVCLTKDEAEQELIRRARPVASGSDGYELLGPCPLSDERHASIVREVLRRTAHGIPGPVPIPPELW